MSGERDREKPSLRLVKGGGQQGENNSDGSRKAPDIEALKERERKDREASQHILEHGGAASKALVAWGRTIPIGDRRQMARNMDAILNQHGIKKSDLNYQRDGISEENFGVILSRSRLSGDGSGKKQLNARTNQWCRIIGYIHEHLIKKSQSISKEQLFERLVRGTLFHPSKRTLAMADELTLFLNGYADKLSSKYDLMTHYSRSSRLRTEYYLKNGRFIEGEVYLEGFQPAHFDSTLSELFSLHIGLPDKKLNKLTPEEWEAIYSDLPCKELFSTISSVVEACNADTVDQFKAIFSDTYGHDLIERWRKCDTSVNEYFDVYSDDVIGYLAEKNLMDLSDQEWELIISRKDIFENGDFASFIRSLDTWKRYIDPRKSIITYANLPGLSTSNYPLYPHAFVGLWDYSVPYDPRNRIINPDDRYWGHEVKSGLEASAVMNVVRERKLNDDLFNYWFIVLLPDIDNYRLAPYLCSDFEGTSITPINEELLSEESYMNNIIAPFPAGGPAFMKSLSDILFDEAERIKEELAETAKNVVKNDPYIKLEKDNKRKMGDLLGTLWND